jgi:hypothetical protein
MPLTARSLLLEVADTFDMPTVGGLVLHPSPEMPRGGFAARRCKATLQLPDGSMHDRVLTLTPTHFKLLSGGSRWSVVVSLDGARKEEVPVGTRVLVNEELANELVPSA